MPLAKKKQDSDLDLISELLGNLKPEHSNKIPKDQHDAIRSKVNELIRVLNCKVHTGQRLCQHDSPQARSVVVLESVLRRGIHNRATAVGRSNGDLGSRTEDDVGSMMMAPSVRIPWKELGKLIGMKEKNIEMVANMVRPYLDQIEIDGATTKKRKVIQNISSRSSLVMSRNIRGVRTRAALSSSRIPKDASTTISSISPSSKTHIENIELPYREEIQKLSIKLQSRLYDPDKAAKLTESLYKLYLLYYVLHNDGRRKNEKGALHQHQHQHQQNILYADLQRNFDKYIGAFFFIAVNESEDGTLPSIGDGSSLSSSKMKKPSESNDKNGQNNHDDEMVIEQSLSIDDIVHVLRLDRTQFLNVLKHVLENVEDMREREKKSQRSVLSSSPPGTSSQDHQVTTCAAVNTHKNKRRKRNLLSNELEELVNDEPCKSSIEKLKIANPPSEMDMTVQRKDRFINHTNFLRWREIILREALMDARKIICREKGLDILHGERISEREALNQAAAKVANKYSVKLSYYL